MDNEKKTLTVDCGAAGERLDIFLAGSLNDVSRSQVQKLIGDELVLLNGERASKKALLRQGDVVEVSGLHLLSREYTLLPQDIPFDVLYEDEYLAAVNKPAGLVVHPGNGNKDGTLVNALLYRMGSLPEGTSAERPGIVHRLDKDTSGVLLVAKTVSAHSALSVLFSCRKIEKRYAGFCIGTPKEEKGVINIPLERSHREPVKRTPSESGKEARTEYQLILHRAGISAMIFKPFTGRTHQIRVHCSTMGFPIIGDALYGGGKERLMRVNPADRPFAYSIFKCFTRHALHAKS
ncbi:MAG: RluA family pseudouridine synthase, partial [Fibrobacter sp.]|nr:RluA family pseudouridine synthase [Fibrobacter sp.]